MTEIEADLRETISELTVIITRLKDELVEQKELTKRAETRAFNSFKTPEEYKKQAYREAKDDLIYKINEALDIYEYDW